MMNQAIAENLDWYSADDGDGRGFGQSGLRARRGRDAMWRALGRQAKGTAMAKAMVVKDAPLPVRWVWTGDYDNGGITGHEVKTIVVKTKRTKREVARRKAIATLFWKCMNIREFFETAGRYYYRTPSALALDYDWVGTERWVSRSGNPLTPERLWTLRSNAERTLAWSWTSEVRTVITTLESLWDEAGASQETMRMFVRPYVGVRRRERRDFEIRRDFKTVRECMMGWTAGSKWSVRGGHHGTRDGSTGERAFGSLGGRCGTGGRTLRECLCDFNQLVSETVMEACVGGDCECCGRGVWKTGKWAVWIEREGWTTRDEWKIVRDNPPVELANIIFAKWKRSFVRHYNGVARRGHY